MPKKTQFVMELKERVDFKLLGMIIASKGIDDDIREQLKRYMCKKKGDYVPVKYNFSKNLSDKGRLYAQGSLSLQNFKKEIRHTLAASRYVDIDMANAHPTLIAQYCDKNNIKCPNLQYYVDKREKILENASKFHNISKSEIKILILRLCYLGAYKIPNYNELQEIDVEEPMIEPDEKYNFLVKLRKELKQIASSICKIEKETHKIVMDDDNKTNKKAATLSITAQVIEHSCLMAMYKYFTERKYEVGTLCFDGLMLRIHKNFADPDTSEQEKKLKKILIECEKYVFRETEYKIKLEQKNMETQLSFELSKYSNYVENDRDAQEQLFRIVGADYFKFCEGILYIYDDRTGMYSKRIEVLYRYLTKYSEYLKIIINPATEDRPAKEESYGCLDSLKNKVVSFVKQEVHDDEWIDKTANTSLGYLLFKNGYYCAKTNIFTEGFTPTIVFHNRIPHDYIEKNTKYVEDAYKLSFGSLFKNQRPIMISLARALVGDITAKKFYFCPGHTNGGKSTLVTMLMSVFGSKLIGTFNAEELVYVSSMNTKDEAARNRWALLLRFSRIVCSNEINMTKSLNGNAIKKLSSGGDIVVARTHKEEETPFVPHFSIFCMLNNIPKIDPMDGAIISRLEYTEFPFKFVKEIKQGDPEYYKPQDNDLSAKIKEDWFIQGMIHLLLDSYQDFLTNGIPEFDAAAKNTWTSGAKQEDEITDVIEEYFEITNNSKDYVTLADMSKFKSKQKVFQTISPTRFNQILEKELGLAQGTVKNELGKSTRCWKGIMFKEDKC
jgi:hypothetical protein